MSCLERLGPLADVVPLAANEQCTAGYSPLLWLTASLFAIVGLHCLFVTYGVMRSLRKGDVPISIRPALRLRFYFYLLMSLGLLSRSIILGSDAYDLGKGIVADRGLHDLNFYRLFPALLFFSILGCLIDFLGQVYFLLRGVQSSFVPNLVMFMNVCLYSVVLLLEVIVSIEATTTCPLSNFFPRYAHSITGLFYLLGCLICFAYALLITRRLRGMGDLSSSAQSMQRNVVIIAWVVLLVYLLRAVSFLASAIFEAELPLPSNCAILETSYYGVIELIPALLFILLLRNRGPVKHKSRSPSKRPLLSSDSGLGEYLGPTPDGPVPSDLENVLLRDTDSS